METKELILQDLSDLLYINNDRVKTYNKHAYLCGDMELKMLLNRKADNARDCIGTLKRSLCDLYGQQQPEHPFTGQLYCLWADFNPTMQQNDIETQLHAFEMSDLLALECYKLVLTRAYIDSSVKVLLEYQHHNAYALYKSLKSFKEAFDNRSELRTALRSA